jgi:uncharacterized protein YyaL (SSP411 family)
MKIKDRPHNRLIHEKSPYLLQHAHNPVDWYPWCDEAFQKAKAEDKPIFLSIGYSTCHWCHVMERESFEDKEVAEILNKHYISIKVDREERPDIDHIYMTVCQALTGHGGWPLTIFMTPDQKPFFAGTYFPKRGRQGMIGLMDLLDRIRKGWQSDRDTFADSASSIVDSMKSHFTIENSGDQLSKDTIDQAYRELKNSFDYKYGGFGYSPKFPTPHNLFFLLRYWKLTDEKEALDMVEKTLDGMYRGGIFDHIGYGFSRYSTDQKWLVPHFEKMLYDNALLAIACLETYQATKKEEYAMLAKKIFTYILRDMTHSQGGFYSAEDADSEGEEGKFYTWTPEEIVEILGEKDGNFFCQYYGITPGGNFEGKSIPNRIHAHGPVNQDEEDIKPLREKVFVQREKRVHPHKDDKILTSWNGLMIAALAIGSRVLDNSQYIDAAEKAFDFIMQKLVNQDGRLLARYRQGEAAHLAYLDDYAFLVWGLIELYHTTFDVKYLELALKFNNEMLQLFNDTGKGGLFLYGEDGESLIARPKEVYDGAMPSGNSVAVLNMLLLARMTGDAQLEVKAYDQLNAFTSIVESSPSAHTYFLMAAIFGLYPTKEIVLAGDKEDTLMQRMVSLVHKSFLPQAVVLFNDGSKKEQALIKMAPYVEGQKPIDGKATAYICQNYSCQTPTGNVDEFARHLEIL